MIPDPSTESSKAASSSSAAAHFMIFSAGGFIAVPQLLASHGILNVRDEMGLLAEIEHDCFVGSLQRMQLSCP